MPRHLFLWRPDKYCGFGNLSSGRSSTGQKAKGIRVAEWLAAEKVDVVLVSRDLTGKGPSYVLRDAGIQARRIDKPTLAEAFPKIGPTKSPEDQ